MKNHRVALALLSALTGVALFATGCSQSADSPGPKESKSGSDGSGTAAFDEAQTLRKCLRDKGMDVPDLQPGENPRSTVLAPPEGTDPAKWAKALQDCGSGKSGSGDAGKEQSMDEQVKIADCLRGKGFDVADPTAGPDGSHSGWQIPQSADPDKFMKALNECAA